MFIQGKRVAVSFNLVLKHCFADNIVMVVCHRAFLSHGLYASLVSFRMDTRLLTIRLVPGFDDAVIAEMIERNAERKLLKALVLQLYGTGNLPSVKESFIQLLADASSRGILVVAATQCFTGSVLLGHYAVGQALESAGVVSANDMTLEATACKIAYLFGRGDLNHAEVAALMGVSLRGEITPLEALSPPPLSSDYQRRIQKGNRFY